MLSEKEKEWLEERTWPVWDYFSCRTCKAMHQATMRCIFGRCPLMTGTYKDAAEFEARVVKEALHVTIGDLPCAGGPDCKAPHFDKYSTEEEPVGCSMCALCAVRLAVEQEMEQ